MTSNYIDLRYMSRQVLNSEIYTRSNLYIYNFVFYQYT